MIKKNRIYAKAAEVYTKAIILYADASKVLFYDEAAAKDKVLNEDLEELFMNDAVIKHNDAYHKPVACNASGLIVCDVTGGTPAAVTFTGSEKEEE